MTLIEEANRLGLRLSVDADGKLDVKGPRTPEVLAILPKLKENKPGIIAALKKPKLVEGQSPEWHAQEVARRVIEKGICLFWAELHGEVIAFIRDESFLRQVPSGMVAYTVSEIETMFDSNIDDSQRRLVHQVKKLASAKVVED